MKVISSYKLSIITINYNNIAGLKRTFNSVFNQDFKDFEFIVIDGNSIDGSKELIIENNLNINYSISEIDSGIYNAMNKGIKVASGEYLLFLNSGDWLVNSSVLNKINQYLNHDLDFIIGKALMIHNDGNIIEDFPRNGKIDFLTFFWGTINHQSTFIKRSLFNEFGLYNEDLKLAADWEFFYKTIGSYKLNTTFVCLPICFYPLDGISAKNQHKWKDEKQNILNKNLTPQIIDFFESNYELIRRNEILSEYLIINKLNIFFMRIFVFLAFVTTKIKLFVKKNPNYTLK